MVEALVKLNLKSIRLRVSAFFCFGDVLAEVLSKAALSSQTNNNSFKMKKISIIIKFDERPDTECRAAHKPILVKGHFRLVGGKKVYVKAHYRNR